MSGDVLGGGVVVALAAALWLAYLIPVWLRRREYLATERNAVRLQQTLRILAETSELPDAVRYEATARTVAEQQRILRRAEEQTKADARAAAEADARRERAMAEAAAGRRRRSRTGRACCDRGRTCIPCCCGRAVRGTVRCAGELSSSDGLDGSPPTVASRPGHGVVVAARRSPRA